MTVVSNLLILIPFVLMCLLILRLLIANWAPVGASLALFLAFLIQLIAFDALIAVISAGLLLMFVPTLARSPLGGQLKRALLAVTDPVVDLVHRGTMGRVSGDPAVFISALLMLAVYIAALFVLRA